MSSGSQLVSSTGSLLDIETEIRSIASVLTPRERLWTSWVGRGFLSWSLRRSGDLESLLTSGSQTQLFTTIIDRRDDAIIRYIQDHPQENIAIVYGALHFNGVYEALQKIDSQWVVTQIESSEPYTPE